MCIAFVLVIEITAIWSVCLPVRSLFQSFCNASLASAVIRFLFLFWIDSFPAGGRIIGKSTCEGFCMSGNSYTGNKGPVLNFHNPLHSSGGSSGGSSTLVSIMGVETSIWLQKCVRHVNCKMSIFCLSCNCVVIANVHLKPPIGWCLVTLGQKLAACFKWNNCFL